MPLSIYWNSPESGKNMDQNVFFIFFVAHQAGVPNVNFLENTSSTIWDLEFSEHLL